ncbi:MAG: cation:proton antiporter [Verrucomicrobia bacterium]|jgi:Kef-type K+ transport system membrane component KefB|nr:cation:proton antiporter [Verrucomicrobiota bacterium]
MNPAVIELHVKQVLIQWTVIVLAAWAFGRLAQRLHQPRAVGEILAGILLGPSALGLVWSADWPVLFPQETQQSLQLLGKIGLIFLLFQVGMEFDFGHLRTRSRTVLAVSVLGIAAPFAAGLAVGPWLHRNFAADLPSFGFVLFFCIALSISALPIMGRMLLEWGLERTPLAAMAISAAAMDDVTGWVLLAVASAVVTAGFDTTALLLQVGGLLLFVLVLQQAVGPGLRRIWRKSTAGQAEPVMSPGYLVLLLVALFGCCLVTNRLGVFSIFGAFLLGVALHAEVSLVRAWRNRFSDFVLVALVPIFFTNTGLHTEIGTLRGGWAWVGCGVVLLVAVAGKLGGCFLAARLTGQSAREAGCIAALMNTRALMALVAINVGLDLKLLNRELFTMLVIMALLTTAMTAPLIKWWLPQDLRSRFRPG